MAGIKVSIRAEFFGLEWAQSQSQACFMGTITKWQKKSEGIMYIMWEGWSRNKANTIATLLGDDENGEPFDLKLEPDANGALPRYIPPAPPTSVAAAAGRRARGEADDDGDDDGSGDADADSDEDSDDDDALREVEKHGRVWHRKPAEAIKVDARSKPRAEPTLLKSVQNRMSIAEMFEACLPPAWVRDQLTYTNLNLKVDGRP